MDPSSVLGPVVAYLCPHQCIGPESAQRCGGHGPGDVGGTFGSPQAVPALVSSHPVAGLWVPAQRLSASWGWYQRWSGGGAQVWAELKASIFMACFFQPCSSTWLIVDRIRVCEHPGVTPRGAVGGLSVWLAGCRGGALRILKSGDRTVAPS